jgi:acyl-CoA synthetase (NDP forming)
LSAEHRARVKETLGPLVAVANPLDYNTFIWNNEPALTATFSTFVSGGFDLNMLVLDFPRSDRCSDTDWWPTVRAFEAALKANGAKGAIVASMGENLPEAYAADLIARGIVPFMGIAEAMDAAEAAAFVGEGWRYPSSPPIGGIGGPAKPGRRGGGTRLSERIPLSVALRAPPLPPMGGKDGREPSEAEAKSFLAGYGFPVPPGRKASTPEEAVSVAKELGFPVALKALGVAHKSEHGAVRLDLACAAVV